MADKLERGSVSVEGLASHEVENIEMLLRRLGYTTNSDGQMTREPIFLEEEFRNAVVDSGETQLIAGHVWGGLKRAANYSWTRQHEQKRYAPWQELPLRMKSIGWCGGPKEKNAIVSSTLLPSVDWLEENALVTVWHTGLSARRMEALRNATSILVSADTASFTQD